MPRHRDTRPRGLTYESLTSRYYYDQALGRFCFLKDEPPRGKANHPGGYWNKLEGAWKLSIGGTSHSMARALWLWHHQELPSGVVVVTGDISKGLWLENLRLRAELVIPLEGVTTSLLREYMGYCPQSGTAHWRASASLSARVGEPWGLRNPQGRTVRFMNKVWPKTHLIWWYMTGELPPEGYYVDHKDGNPGNNRWGNLRLVSPAQNASNSLTLGGGNHLSRGVVRWGRNFMARATKSGVRHRRGPFPTPEAAHEAYKALHITLHGEFSVYASRPEETT